MSIFFNSKVRISRMNQKEHLDALGPDLGHVYHALYNECAWLHIKWHQYLVLYGTKPERIDLLNRSAGLFFRIVQDTLWEDTLLHLARLTDRPTSMGKNNLSVQRLPSLIRGDYWPLLLIGAMEPNRDRRNEATS